MTGTHEILSAFCIVALENRGTILSIPDEADRFLNVIQAVIWGLKTIWL
jgi:hypothetical protein